MQFERNRSETWDFAIRLEKFLGLKNTKKIFPFRLYRKSQKEWEFPSKDLWLDVKPGYLYLAYMKGRTYYMLPNVIPENRPKITAHDKKKRITLNTFTIEFKRKKDYEVAKICLLPFSRCLTLRESIQIVQKLVPEFRISLNANSH